MPDTDAPVPIPKSKARKFFDELIFVGKVIGYVLLFLSLVKITIWPALAQELHIASTDSVKAADSTNNAKIEHVDTMLKKMMVTQDQIAVRQERQQIMAVFDKLHFTAAKRESILIAWKEGRLAELVRPGETRLDSLLDMAARGSN